jgi:hypothetical protein
MILTEREAGAYFCPNMLAIKGGCMGSRCMAWRWLESTSFGGFTPGFLMADDREATKEPERPTYVPRSWIFKAFHGEQDLPAGWIEPEEEFRDRVFNKRRGFCGLAGVPVEARIK